ncbi:MAG: hypothetical protein RLZZ468_1855 [Cyanobacteriota bacterium]
MSSGLPVLPQRRLSLLAGLVLLASGPLPAGSQAIPALEASASRAAAAAAPSAVPGPHGGPYSLSPQRRALLDTIRYAEGTWRNGHVDGYRMLYGGGLFQRLDRHPDVVVRSRYASAAAGAYQFMPSTWQTVASRLRLTSFEPHNQDQAALHLIRLRGGLSLLDRQGLSRELVARLAPEWASLPTRSGGSYYGQPVKDFGELQQFYGEALRRHSQG